MTSVRAACSASCSASVIAKVPTVVGTVASAAFREMLQTHPVVAMVLLRRLAKIVRESTDRIMDLSTLGAHNRIYAELLRLAHESDAAAFDKAAPQARIRPVPAHTDIAARVSTARETVTRVLSDLTKKAILERDRDALVILDVPRLTKMVKEFKAE
jgi:CRP/FNR family transcriptional regulator, cyclic AMP receptor protein